MADELNSRISPGEFNASCQCQMGGFMDRITINAAAYSRKGDALQVFPAGQIQAVVVCRDQKTGLAVTAATINRSDGVNDIACLQMTACCDNRLAGRAASDLTAFGHNGRSAGAVNSAIYAATAGETAVGGINDGICVFPGDVSTNEFDERLIKFGLHVSYSAGILFPSP